MEGEQQHKDHHQRNAGRKADKKKEKKKKDKFAKSDDKNTKSNNVKAFAINSAVRAERRFRRKEDIETKKCHIPLVDRTPLEPPPILVAVVGPPKVGKSLLIRCLLKSLVKQPISSIIGPITVVSSKKRRITFIECNNDINSMIDLAKVADLVLLLIDASFGFEMEIFEFLNICQVHGMIKVMGVLTHLDLIKNQKTLRRTKKTLKHRFWTEVYPGAKLFYLSGLIHDEYLKNEIKNLSRFISVIKFRPLTWRTTHPYLLADRIEDITSPELIRQNGKIDRHVCIYGYIRGIPLNKQSSIHIPGCGDFTIKDVNFIPDPCPLPEHYKKRALIEKEKLIYAPFSGIGGILYDKDAVYIELGGSHSHSNKNSNQNELNFIDNLLESQATLDQKLEQSQLQLFTESAPIKSKDVDVEEDDEEDSNGLPLHYNQETVVDNGRVRRKVVFNDQQSKNENSDEEDVDEDDEEGAGDSDDEDEHEVQVHQSKRKNPNDSASIGSNKKQKVDADNELEMELAELRANSDEERDTDKDLDEEMEANCDEDESEEEIEQPSSLNSSRKEKKLEKSFELSENKGHDVKNKIAEVLSRFEKKNDQGDLGSGSIDADDDEDDDGDDDEDDDEDDDGDDDEDDDGDDDESFDELSEDDLAGDDKEEEESDDDETEALEWKQNLAERAKEAFIERQKRFNIMKLVYGADNIKSYDDKKENEEVKEAEDENEIGGIFKVVSNQQKQKLEEKELKNQEESVYFSKEPPRDWLSDHNKSLIINKFVTGKWKDSEDAEELIKLDDLNEDEVYGDFEDLETGKKVNGADENGIENEIKEKEKLLEKKRKLKEQFNSDYDNKESKNYYDELREEVERQSKLNKSEFENLDDNLRVKLEGYRPGMYIRIELEKVPCELIVNHDPRYPLVVGGLNSGEENIGFVQGRIKKHRWYSKILKTRDPLIFSLGWRRFQSLPIYSKLEDDMKNRMLKYTPEHVACMINFWGPITPQGTGVLAVQNINVNDAAINNGFRIAATGSIVELDKTIKIVKKLKLTGVPMKIYKKTAFIKDMFNSNLEVAKFEGAKIKTVSGIRGQIKKPISRPDGAFRATFEDKIQLSDIVFCRTWYPIDIPKFYNPVNSLLLPISEKNQWSGMKTTGQLKRIHNVHALPNSDSLYTPITRPERIYKPLVIPKSLEKELPYRDKPKYKAKEDPFALDDTKHTKVAVIRDPKEENVAKLMKMLRTNYDDKQKRVKEAMRKRMTEYKAKVDEEQLRALKRQRTMKKQVFRTLSKMEAKEKRGK